LAHLVFFAPCTRVSSCLRSECELIARFVEFGMVIAL
jgi:hypothetical protein